ncbi:hypothetical protein GWK47_019963 [Chionoecetes opilio]|uniref:Reverse transcriptase domain-containing protein n=1 Tax=Chionoecetes opilio TaxID=41210 RepID=A0A8J4XYL9_CHIOP|nr:hypothetical protein GWK47_019963 [Chionoecetes opilio]
MDWVLGKVVDQCDCGASLGNTKITDLVVTDDSVIFAESLEVLLMALKALHEEVKSLGLEVSWLKTKVQVFGGLLDETVHTQIRSALKKKAFEDAGISPQTAVALQAQQNTAAQAGASSGGGSMLGGRDVTLNMLNASESEVDVEGMGAVGMDFEGANEVVTS